MATHVTTMPRRGGLRPPATAQQRAALEEAIARGIAALDALDALAADMEPDHEGEHEPDEASAQPAILAPDWRPARVIRFPARPAVRS